MTATELKTFREARQWNQAQAAERLGVTQGYLSQLERGQRKLTPRLQAKLVALGGFPPLALPVHDPSRWLAVPDPDEEFARELGHLGYPGSSYHRGRPKLNPAELLMGALVQSKLDTRVAEALPWLAATFSDMDWKWVVSHAKLNDAQNRLGFVVTLARDFAESKALYQAAGTLNAVAKQLERSRLEREDTFCNDGLTAAERNWLKEHRPQEALQWHLLTDLTRPHLPYA